MTLSTAEILEKLVGFDTTSDRSNLPLIDWVETYLEGLGVLATRVPDESGDYANLVATIGPQDQGGIALSGHTDCVPVTGQPWDTDPFTLTKKGSKLYGRGSCDMKGFDAAVLAAVPKMLEQPLNTAIHIVLSYDEEVGCTGVRRAIAEMGKSLPMPKAVIVGEPTNMQVVDAHKGIAGFTTTVTGVEAHSSLLHTGANSILAAAQLLGELIRIRDEIAQVLDPSGRFDPPYTSVHVGRIEGGTANNIVPRQCWFNWEIRTLPGFDENIVVKQLMDFANREVLPGLKAVSESCSIETMKSGSAPALAPDHGSLAERIALRAAQSNSMEAVSYMTEAGLFQVGGAPAILCGPGDIAQAHKPNEFVEIAQLDSCDRFLERVIDIAREGVQPANF